ncbi:MAG: pitrilysin family protein [Candidatus Gastranaerophilales bacterium]|nr:pitrilysin family protein [Candidatus Gastranaerophilales bacterium]
MKKTTLNNNIPAVIKQNKNTPRIALSFYLRLKHPEKKAGIYTILNRLFMQGTKVRTSEELAQELEENAIELSSDMKHDFIRFRLLCLNEDIEHALELMEDIICNSHFENFDKEIEKIKGEIIAELDSPRTKALDNYYKTLFEGHFYGNTYTKVLEAIDSITRQDILDAYSDIIKTSKKNITVVGDINENEIINLLNKYTSTLTNPNNFKDEITKPILTKDKIVPLEKDDAQQAQIIQGWLFPSMHCDDYPAIMLINTILGSSGLSSRLFLELREKQGLAYVVRSSCEAYHQCASFSVYIATEPKNIKTSLEGFKKEIEKIKSELVTEKEIEGARNNIIGKRQFFMETNHLQATLIGLYESEDLGFNYEEQLLKRLETVTPQKILEVANKYFSTPKVLSILAPKQYLSQLENVIL